MRKRSSKETIANTWSWKDESSSQSLPNTNSTTLTCIHFVRLPAATRWMLTESDSVCSGSGFRIEVVQGVYTKRVPK